NNSEYTDYKLYLAGSVKDEDKKYFAELKALAESNNNIQFFPNVTFTELLELYKKSEYYWHFTGYEVDETNHPERTEHLGITPLEAMSQGCLTYAYRVGGPKEIIQDGETGF